jgi:hypothetical protein
LARGVDACEQPYGVAVCFSGVQSGRRCRADADAFTIHRLYTLIQPRRNSPIHASANVQAPLPSMLMAMPFSKSTSAKAALANWLF